MVRVLAHRGPDGEYLYQDGPASLGASRLAVLDPEAGAQPMFSEDRAVAAVYNGEIYNYSELRQRLLDRRHRLQTRCDTELLPHLYEDEGIEFVRRLNGIFAFALWDRNRGRLYLVRDPIGVKPLVYCQLNGRLAFGSEAKAILASRLVQPRLDEESLHLGMNLRYIPGARTLFRGIRRLPPGHYLAIDERGPTLERYHTLDWTPDHSLSEAEWIEGIRHSLERAVRRQLQSDVPLGLALSGGVDSSAVLAMMRRAHAGPIRTFTLGFDEPWDENEDARFVSEHFETEHREITLSDRSLDHLRDAIYFTEEPKVNNLQLFLLHRFIGRHVKVSLSGLGGDELFGGYDIYRYLAAADPLRRMPDVLMRRAVSPALDRLALIGGRLGRPGLDLHVRGLEWLASARDGARHYLLLRNAWDFNPALLSRVYSPDFLDRLRTRSREPFDPLFSDPSCVMGDTLRAEFATKMVDDLLHNEDTMSMAHSVESRVPFLDLELVRFVARIPNDLRFRYGPKGLLKKALSGVVPDRVLTRRKWGFSIDPVHQYRKDLRSAAKEFLASERLRETGIFNPRFVEGILRHPPRRRLRWHYFMLLQMIGFELWRELFLQGGWRSRSPGGGRVFETVGPS